MTTFKEYLESLEHDVLMNIAQHFVDESVSSVTIREDKLVVEYYYNDRCRGHQWDTQLVSFDELKAYIRKQKIKRLTSD